MTARIGLIVNPIAGMGGRVGLKGTDGEALSLARERGARPLSPYRAELCLRALRSLLPSDAAPAFFTGPADMGEVQARCAGFAPTVCPRSGPSREETTAADTAAVARWLLDAGVDLLLFAGGDGTARDVCRAIGERLPVLGIPAGVKIHSAAFARSPQQAAALAARYLGTDAAVRTERLGEVMDIDEDAYRAGSLRAKLYGYLRVPDEPGGAGMLQGLKSGSPTSDAEDQQAVADWLAELVENAPETLFLVGAGTTTRALSRVLGEEGTLLGIDAWRSGRLLAADLAERDILALLDASADAKILVTPIGGQGFLFGRGNQQFSPEVIRRVGTDRVIVIATPGKLAALGGAPLLADTGDPELDASLEGYCRVVTGYGQYTMHKIRAA